MKNYLILFLAVAVVVCKMTAQTPALTIKKTSKPVVVDGVVNSNDPWGSAWINLTANKTMNTTSDITAKFQMTYNDTYLWFVVQVNGDVAADTDDYALPNWWESDNIWAFLKMDTTSGDGSYIDGDFNLSLRRGSVFPYHFVDNSPGRILLGDPNVRIGQVNNETSYTQEWQLPWTSLVSTMSDPGNFDKQYFKFELAAADNTTNATGGRTQIVFWRNNSDEQWHNTNTFSLIKLETPVNITIPKDSVYFISPVHSTVWTTGSAEAINVYFKTQKIDYDYAVYYQKIGGTNNYLGEIYHAGYSSTNWNISNTFDIGKYRIVLYDYYGSKYYYSDTFTVKQADPEIKIVSPFNGSHIQSGNFMNVSWYSVYKDSIDLLFSSDFGENWDTLVHKQAISDYSSMSKKIFISNTSNKTGILKIINSKRTLSDSIVIHLTTEPVYKFTSPTDTSKWRAGSDVSIKFSKSDSLDNYWFISCYKVGSTSSIFDADGTQIGLVDYSVYLDQMVDSGRYYLQISDSFTGQTSNSDTFNIIPAAPLLNISSPGTNYYILSGEKFNLIWSSVGIDKIFVVFSRDGGATWDTLAKNIPSPNSYYNSALVKAPTMTGTIANCILRIGCPGKSLSDFVSPITISNVSPYRFISPDKNTKWTADSTYTVQFYNNSNSDYCYVYYQKLDSNNNMNYVNYSYQIGFNSFLWQINQLTEPGNYVLAIYDYNLGRYFYSDTFYINPAASKLELVSPASNDYLVSEETFKLNWSAINSGLIDVECSKDGGSTWDIIATNLNSPNSYYNTEIVKVPKVSATYNNCLLKIINKSHTAFSIVTKITISNKSPYEFVSPNASTTWVAGTTVTVKFNNYLTHYWDLYCEKIGGSLNYIFWNSQTGLVNYSWNISTYFDSGYYRMAVYDESLNRFFYSDTFYIAPASPSLVLNTPQSGSTIFSKSTFSIVWQAVNSGNINVEISKNGGVTWDTIARNIYSNDSDYYSYQLKAPAFDKIYTGCILKITNHSNTAFSLAANLTFSNITPYEFVSPTKHSKVYAGSTMNIKVINNIKDTWYVDFYYKKIGGYSDYFNYGYASDSIITSWDIPQYIDSGRYQIYFYDGALGQNIYSDTFSISPPPPSLILTAPHSGSVIYSGSKLTVVWQSLNSGNINIEISKDAGLTWETIAGNIYSYNSNSNSYQVTMPVFKEVYSNGVLRISNLSNSLSSMVSHLTFSNKPAYVFVNPTKSTLAKNGSEVQIKMKNALINDYCYMFYMKIGGNSNYISSGTVTDSVIITTWNIPDDIDSGSYEIYLYSGTLDKTFYSEIFHIDFTSSVDQISQIAPGLNVYPNPFGNKLELSFELPERSTVVIGMYDIVGKLVKTVYNGSVNKGKQHFSVDASDLQSGMYILQLKTSQGYTGNQFVVKK
jgi:hypothetical protein